MLERRERRVGVDPTVGIGSGGAVDLAREGPEPALYGRTLLVIAIVRSVRPWKPLSKTTTAGRPVAERAILTAFSIASAPELTRIDFWFAPAQGECSASRRQTSTYGS